jgi:bifunctional non-homologous end joining protein LigD
VYSRTGLNWTNQFSAIAEHLKVRQVVLSGEAVVYGAAGIPDFQALRRELGKKGSGLHYHAFDLLHLDSYELRNVPYASQAASEAGPCGRRTADLRRIPGSGR